MTTNTCYFKRPIYFRTNAGVPAMTATFISIGVHCFLANLSVMANIHIAKAIILLSGLYISFTWIIALIGFNHRNYDITRSGLIFWTLFLVFWVFAVIWAFISKNGEEYVCTWSRCPESMWLFNDSWHAHSSLLLILENDYVLDENYVIKEVLNRSEQLVVDPIDYNRVIDYQSHDKYEGFLEEPNSFAIKKLYDELGLNNNFVGSKFLTIFIILIMCGILGFGWAVLFRFMIELKKTTDDGPLSTGGCDVRFDPSCT